MCIFKRRKLLKELYKLYPMYRSVYENSRKVIKSLNCHELRCLDPDNIYETDYYSVVMEFEVKRGRVAVEIGVSTIGMYTDFEDGSNYSAEKISTDFKKLPDVIREFLK